MRIKKSGQLKNPAGELTLLRASTKFVLFCTAFLLIMGRAPGQKSALFDSDKVLEFTLRADLKTVFRDRGENPEYYPASIAYDSGEISFNIPIKVRTRGHFRKLASNCKYPPLLLNFAKSRTPQDCLFNGQDKMKLVTPCRGDQLVIHEYLVYKMYNLITPKSFNARLVKVVFQDTVKSKSTQAHYGILLEEEQQMAIRNRCKAIQRTGLNPEATREDDFLKMAVFQYMIGNTDWSVQFQQNIKLIMAESSGLPSVVPYDFDHAGIVRAPYAKPAEELQLSSTLERRYRGYCIRDMDGFNEVFEIFRQLKDEFYAIYEKNELLTKSYRNQTLKFLDQFYKTINDPKTARQAFSYPCNPHGTGNVVIKGLKK